MAISVVEGYGERVGAWSARWRRERRVFVAVSLVSLIAVGVLDYFVYFVGFRLDWLADVYLFAIAFSLTLLVVLRFLHGLWLEIE